MAWTPTDYKTHQYSKQQRSQGQILANSFPIERGRMFALVGGKQQWHIAGCERIFSLPFFSCHISAVARVAVTVGCQSFGDELIFSMWGYDHSAMLQLEEIVTHCHTRSSSTALKPWYSCNKQQYKLNQSVVVSGGKMNHFVSFKAYSTRWVSDKCILENIKLHKQHIRRQMFSNDRWNSSESSKVFNLDGLKTVTAYHPVDEIVKVIFPPFRHRSANPLRAKREGNYRCRKTRAQDKTDFFTKRNMRTVLECLFVCWPGWKLRNIHRWNMDMMLNILTSYCLHSRRTMKHLLLKSVDHTMFLIHHHVLILNN